MRPLAALAVPLALLGAGALAGCETKELYPEVMPLPGDAVGTRIFLIRDDALTVAVPPYNLVVDDAFASQDGFTPLRYSPNVEIGVPLTPGLHVLKLVDGDGHVVTASPSFRAAPGILPTIIFYGGPAAMQARVLFDDPTTLAAGATRARLMNALADHQPIQMVQCPADLNGSQLFTASACAPIGDPIAYGDVLERDFGTDVIAQIGFHWAAPDADEPIVSSISLAASIGAFILRIPTQVQGTGACPSCLLTLF
jgi:hypothetical protein